MPRLVGKPASGSDLGSQRVGKMVGVMRLPSLSARKKPLVSRALELILTSPILLAGRFWMNVPALFARLFSMPVSRSWVASKAVL